MEAAAWWFIAMERQCQVQLLAEAVGPVQMIDPQTAAMTAVIQGSGEVGRQQFSVLYGLITRTEPDVLT